MEKFHVEATLYGYYLAIAIVAASKCAYEESSNTAYRFAWHWQRKGSSSLQCWFLQAPVS